MVTSHCIWHFAHHCEISNPLLVTIEAALFNFKAATKEYQDLQPKASQLQAEFLQQKLLSPGLSDENQQAIHWILTAGQSQNTFHAICQLKFPDPMALSISHLSRRLSNISVRP